MAEVFKFDAQCKCKITMEAALTLRRQEPRLLPDEVRKRLPSEMS